MQRIEEHEQIVTANWLRENGVFFTISPSGMVNSPRLGKRLKMMGYRAGTPDLIILEPRAQFKCLFVELKRQAVKHFKMAKGRQSPDQKEFEAEAIKRWYKYLVCYGAVEAIEQIQKYLDLKY